MLRLYLLIFGDYPYSSLEEMMIAEASCGFFAWEREGCLFRGCESWQSNSIPARSPVESLQSRWAHVCLNPKPVKPYKPQERNRKSHALQSLQSTTRVLVQGPPKMSREHVKLAIVTGRLLTVSTGSIKVIGGAQASYLQRAHIDLKNMI